MSAMGDGASVPIGLSDDALGYVKQKGATIVLRPMLRNGCCGGRVELMKAEIGVPRATDRFGIMDIDGVTVYVERGLAASLEEPVRIGLDKLFGMRALFVERA